MTNIVIHQTGRIKGMRAKIYIGGHYFGKAEIELPELSFEDRLRISERLLNRWLRRTGKMSEMIKALKSI